MASGPLTRKEASHWFCCYAGWATPCPPSRKSSLENTGHGSQHSPVSQLPSMIDELGIMSQVCGGTPRANETLKVPSCTCWPEKDTGSTLREPSQGWICPKMLSPDLQFHLRAKRPETYLSESRVGFVCGKALPT
jgi:hypothetical protein